MNNSLSFIDGSSSILRRRFKIASQYHPNSIISDPKRDIQTRSLITNLSAFSTFVSLVEPKDIKEAIKEPEWIIAMQAS